jgi:hypothetical protein
MGVMPRAFPAAPYPRVGVCWWGKWSLVDIRGLTRACHVCGGGLERAGAACLGDGS